MLRYSLFNVLFGSRDLAGARGALPRRERSDLLSRRVPRTLCFLSSDPGILTLEFCQRGPVVRGESSLYIIT